MVGYLVLEQDTIENNSFAHRETYVFKSRFGRDFLFNVRIAKLLTSVSDFFPHGDDF